MRILITGARAPVALHLARCFHQSGHDIVLADSMRFPLSRATRFKTTYATLPAPAHGLERYGRAVEAVIREHRCDLIIPTCEEVFHLAAWRDLYGGLIPLFAPSFDLLKTCHDKFAFSAFSEGCGADAPPTRLLTCRDDIEAVGPESENLVFKPVWSRFGARVLVKPGKAALASLEPTPDDLWVAQEYLPGAETCCWSVLHEGRIMALSCYTPLHRVGGGASIAFQMAEEPEIAAFVSAFGAKTQWTGQIAFDFRRGVTGSLHVIECNPRATSGIHLFGPGAALADAMLGRAIAAPNQKKSMTLPLAFLAYGLPDALRKYGLRGLNHWRREARAMDDFTAWPNDRSTVPMQILNLIELTTRALRLRTGLSTASTADIEWNGGAFALTSPGAMRV